MYSSPHPCTADDVAGSVYLDKDEGVQHRDDATDGVQWREECEDIEAQVEASNARGKPRISRRTWLAIGVAAVVVVAAAVGGGVGATVASSKKSTPPPASSSALPSTESLYTTEHPLSIPYATIPSTSTFAAPSTLTLRVTTTRTAAATTDPLNPIRNISA